MTQSSEAQRIVAALKKLHEEAKIAADNSDDYAEESYARGVRDALSRAQAIAEGFK